MQLWYSHCNYIMNLPSKLTFHSLLENSCSLYSDRPALSYVGNQPLTYHDVRERTAHLSSLLTALSVKEGDRVALLGQNMPHWGVAYLAITSMGAVVVPVLVDFTAPELARILEHSGAKVIIVSEKLCGLLHQELPSSLNHAILLDDFREISLGNLEMAGAINYLEERPDIPAFLGGEPQEDDLAAILYTSGTTGTPKGVMLSHRNLLSNAVNTLGIQDVDTTDRLLSVLPLPHTYECTIGFLIPFMMGASVYYLEKLPTPAVLLPAMEEVKPTMMLTVPLIIEKVYQNRVVPKLQGSWLMRNLVRSRFIQKTLHKMAGKKIYKAFGGSLHFFGIGGAKLDAATELFLRDAGFPYAIGYGLTETSPLLAGCTPKKTRYRSTGFGLPNQQIKILNPDSETGVGEIIAKGPNVMLGYYREPDLTKEVFTGDGWFKTGDLGFIDEDGYLYIKGRIKNIIVSATGENIYPEDIEAVINGERNVLESLVYEIKGKLVARVHLNYQEIDMRYHELREMAGQSYQELKESAGQSYQGFKDSAGQGYQELKESASQLYEQANQKVRMRLDEIREHVNARLNRFSRLAVIEEQEEPFEKTPTKKIKRFLYHHKNQRDA